MSETVDGVTFDAFAGDRGEVTLAFEWWAAGERKRLVWELVNEPDGLGCRGLITFGTERRLSERFARAWDGNLREWTLVKLDEYAAPKEVRRRVQRAFAMADGIVGPIEKMRDAARGRRNS